MTVVAIDAFHLRPSGKGVSRVLANLTPRLLALSDERLRYIAFTTAAGFELLSPRVRSDVVVVPDIPDSLWVHWGLPRLALRAGVDFLYLLREVGPLWGPPYLLHIPEDPEARWSRIPPNFWRTRVRAALDRITMGRSVHRAQVLATLTATTASHLARKLGMQRGQFAVVPLGVDPAFSRRSRDPLRRKRRNIFHLGSDDPRDNTMAVAEAYLWLERREAGPIPPLIIAGGLGPLAASVRALATASTTGSIRVIGRVSDKDLRLLYEEATVCVQPSSDEGFGLQPLEAMAAGTAVIALDTPSVREVVGSAALFVPSCAPEVLGEAISRLVLDDGLREELGRRGLECSGTYTWEQTADLIHRLVRGTLVETEHPMRPVTVPGE